MGNVLTKDQALELTISVTDIVWKTKNLTITRDGYTEEGVRIHFVKESGWSGEFLSNALVFSE